MNKSETQKICQLFDIEEHLARQGNFNLIDWLLAKSLISYSHYEQWRRGEMTYLDDVIQLDYKQTQALIANVEKHSSALKLIGETQRFYQWGTEAKQTLIVSRMTDIERGLTRLWARADDELQLDIFLDSPEVGMENELQQALANRQFTNADKLLLTLSKLKPSHPNLGGYRDLINYGQYMLSNSQIVNSENVNTVEGEHALHEEIDGLKNEVQPLAIEILAARARDYIALAWQRLANNLAGRTFNASQPNLHQSFALENIPDWPAVEQCLLVEPKLNESPELLHRLALAYENQAKYSESLLQWCYLFDKYPAWGEAAIEQNKQSRIYDLWDEFFDRDVEVIAEYFAGYILIKNKGLVHQLKAKKRFGHPVTQSIEKLLSAQFDGKNDIPFRQALQSLAPSMLTVFIAAG